MELRSRSRSKTPFHQHEIIKTVYDDDDDDSEASNKNVRITRATRRQSVYKAVSVEQRTATSTTTTTQTRASSKRASADTTSYQFVKTSDYSSEDGDSEASRHMRRITENDKNRIIEDARAAANGAARVSALNLYRQAGAGRYCDKYPKTDWTYSPHSKDRVEIAPGVVAMPNMSRRTIHSYDGSSSSVSDLIQSESYLSEAVTGSNNKVVTADEIDYNITDIKPQQLFAINNNTVDGNNSYSSYSSSYNIKRVQEKSSVRNVVSRFFISIYMLITNWIYYVYETHNYGLVWSGKKLHRFVSWVMLMDTWLMRKQEYGRCRNNKTKNVLLLCLLPLLLFGGWCLLSTTAHSIHSAFSNFSTTTVREPSVISISENIDDTNIQQQIQSSSSLNLQQQSAKSPPNQIPSNTLSDEQLETITIAIKKSLNINHNFDQNNNNFAIMNDKIINDLENKLNDLKLELFERKSDINRIVYENARNLATLKYELSKCCHKSFINIESYVKKILNDLLNNPDYLRNNNGLNDWLKSMFIAREDFDNKLMNLTGSLNNQFATLIENNGKSIMDEILTKITLEFKNNNNKQQSIVNNNIDDQIITTTVSDERIKQIVKETLTIYDADRTGLVDYAMEPMGGQVVTTRCTENYHSGSAVVSILGIPLWYPANTPRTVITPAISPGECWAFQNFPGFLVIKLAATVHIEAVTLEHVNKLLVPGGRIDSAPKEFQVYGLREENDKEPILLGDFVYDDQGDALQYFRVLDGGRNDFDMIELRIVSNHGNPSYTCLYRFRVHGHILEAT